MYIIVKSSLYGKEPFFCYYTFYVLLYYMYCSKDDIVIKKTEMYDVVAV